MVKRTINIFLFKTLKSFLGCAKHRINVLSVLSKSYRDEGQSMVKPQILFSVQPPQQMNGSELNVVHPHADDLAHFGEVP